ncbi:NADPH-dependent glutamate synthase [Adlercreutzia faecimuris]|uniref:NADPH-dependent glutamate synthase n=1 Tax=Adlercreutzia faecimuris TaxID=2897341 RepID=A0ABS9WET7_9ACTN|nr:NADPH-dependent glutamate synthase [Adlercreutzia sp. JBNU-10]MCI2241379.1 NADPH-dependent glutamate synthase [Adlercreutzia sp. JBNU-10]
MAKMVNYNRQGYKTPMPVLDPAERAHTFAEVSLGYNAERAVNEARRCIQCNSRPCVAGCPVGVPVREFVGHIARRDFPAAYAAVKDANALPAICGRVCPQESQCEGVCMRGRKGEAVGIGRLERFIADWAEEHPDEAARALAERRAAHLAARADAAGAAADAEEITPLGGKAVPVIPPGTDLSAFRVAVVGSGPASLTCAGELAKAGASVTVFEALHAVGGVLTYGIPEFRLPKSLVAREVAAIEELGVTFEVNAVVGKLFDIDELMGERGFDAVFVATGAGLPSYLGIEGEGLNGVCVANELLTRVNLMRAYEYPEYETPVFAGQRCVVVGGGNVAMDAARTARRLGADVTVVYRRSREEMPARREEIRHAEEEGIRFATLTNPVRLIGDDAGWLTGVEVVDMELGEPDDSGRRRPHEVAGSNHVISCDMFVISIGNKTNPLIAQTTPGLDTTPRNLIVVDEETCATSVPGVFAGGDAVSGAATVILAMGAGKRAAAGIAAYLNPEGPAAGLAEAEVAGLELVAEEAVVEAEAAEEAAPSGVPAEERAAVDEEAALAAALVAAGIAPDVAARAAAAALIEGAKG